MADAEKKVFVRFETAGVLEDEKRRMIGCFEAGSVHELPVSSFLFWSAQGKAREATPAEVKEAQAAAKAAKAAPEKAADKPAAARTDNTKDASHAEAATAPAAVGEPAKPAADKRR